MRVSLSSLLLLAASGVAHAASSWSFSDASITVKSKESNGNVVEKFDAKTALDKAVALGSTATATITLTTTDGGKAKRPHQAFLLLQDPVAGLEAPFPLTVRESGKGSVQISQKEIPAQLLAAAGPLRASIVIGSFGSAQAYVGAVFDLTLPRDADAPAPSAASAEPPLRYGKRPAIHHIFRPDAQSPPKVISLVFALAVAATVPALFGAWLLLGANVGHLGTALAAAPVSHAAFFGSLVAMEGVFFLYYTRWNLFQVLPVAGLVGAVTVLSGTKALGEVQARRLAGER